MASLTPYLSLLPQKAADSQAHMGLSVAVLRAPRE